MLAIRVLHRSSQTARFYPCIDIDYDVFLRCWLYETGRSTEVWGEYDISAIEVIPGGTQQIQASNNKDRLKAMLRRWFTMESNLVYDNAYDD